jgi:hypothetical protein
LARARLIHDLLHQDLTDTLRDTTMNLARKCEGIDNRPDVVDNEIGEQLDRAGLGVDFDLADVTSV